VSLIGKLASGKTTLADYLVEKYGFVKISFASPIKEICDSCCPEDTQAWKNIVSMLKAAGAGLSVGRLNDILKETFKIPAEKGKNRKRYQYFGTDGCRKLLDDGIWYKYLLREIVLHPEINYAVDDCRFINEADALEKFGFLQFKLLVSEEQQLERVGESRPEVLRHASELEIDDIHHGIILAGDIDGNKVEIDRYI